jgi:hypothetical protein
MMLLLAALRLFTTANAAVTANAEARNSGRRKRAECDIDGFPGELILDPV